MAVTAEDSQPNIPQLLRVDEVAQLLKVKPRTIYDMVQQERIPFRRPPGSNILRFDLDEVLAWTRGENNGGKNKR